MAQEIEATAHRRVDNLEDLTQLEAAAVLDSLVVSGIARSSLGVESDESRRRLATRTRRSEEDA
jgi:hypothetical protein